MNKRRARGLFAQAFTLHYNITLDDVKFSGDKTS